MRRSRLSEQMERQSEKTIVLATIGSLIIIVLLVIYGVPALIRFSLFLQNTKGQAPITSSETNTTPFIPAPDLNPLPDATNSAHVIISGSGQKGQTIDLFVNNAQIDHTQANSDGTFSFPSVTLHGGNNTIATKAETNDHKTSDYSNTLQITYSNNPPTLTVTSPTDGETFSGSGHNEIIVQGETDPGVRVTVNGAWAQIEEGSNFSYNMQLNNGDNSIDVVATDQAGNKSEKKLKVTYNP